MKIRNGFVSNSSSSSFIIDFGNEIKNPEDIKIQKSAKDMKDFDIIHLLYGLLWNGYGESLRDWCRKNFPAVDIDYDADDYLDQFVKYFEKYDNAYDLKRAQELRDMFAPNTSYVFDMGNNTRFCSDSYELENDPWRRDRESTMYWILSHRKEFEDMFKQVYSIYD